MSIVFSQAGCAADKVEVKRHLTMNSCIRCMNKSEDSIAIVVGRMEFTLCTDCYEFFLKKLNAYTGEC